jgi:hypothetical protein
MITGKLGDRSYNDGMPQTCPADGPRHDMISVGFSSRMKTRWTLDESSAKRDRLMSSLVDTGLLAEHLMIDEDTVIA